MTSSLRTDEELEEIYNRHVDTVYRVCYSFMKTAPDAEDMVQETFLKLIVSQKQFQSNNHEKAWLIVTASNTCKDALKRRKRKIENIDDHPSLAYQPSVSEDRMLSVILSLPVKYKEVVYLYYYEGYQTNEIAKMLHCSDSTVRNRLARARKYLRKNMD